MARGANTTANGVNSVALGQGSIADRDNTLSVGSNLQQRQITNVAKGTQGTDAVNLYQLGQVQQTTLGQANRYASQAAAQAMALPTVAIAQGRNDGLAASTASYAGYAALGVEYAQRVSSNMQLQLGGSFSSGGQVATRASAMVSW